MIARRVDGTILLLTFSNIFHDLKVTRLNRNYKDKYGRSWNAVLDQESQLKCFTCQTCQIFPDNPVKESQVQYLKN